LSAGTETQHLDPYDSLLEVGATIGRYTICEELGSGGMATVYRALSRGPGGVVRPVALKIVHRHLTRDRRFVAMLTDEARILSRIAHPNVAALLEFGNADGAYFIAMEYLDGVSLAAVMHAFESGHAIVQSPRRHAHAAAMIHDACEGLHAAHELRDEAGLSLGVVHRDVSPQNVVVAYGGPLKVVDFGVAYMEGRERATYTEPGLIKGKFAYLAPEQLSGRVDRRSDVWAAGVCLWELLAGARLFAGDSEVHMVARVAHEPIRPPSELDPTVPEALDRIVMRALERDCGRRYATAREMALDLERFAIEAGVPVGIAARAELLAELLPDRAPRPAISAEVSAITRRLDSGAPRISREDARDIETRASRLSREAVAVIAPREAVREPSIVLPVASWWQPRAFGLALIHLAVALAVVATVLHASRRAPSVRPSSNATAEIVRAPARPRAAAASEQVDSPDRPVAASERLPAEPAHRHETRPTGAMSETRATAPRERAEPTARPSGAPGTVNIVTTGTWADVREGGRLLGRAPMRVSLPPGRHVLRIEPPSGRPRVVAVLVRSGRRHHVVVRMDSP
jgi:serine/threonine-protein kinase